MKILKLIFLFLILIHLTPVNANEDKLQNKITKNLRCLVCQGQSIYDSDSEFAVSLKLVVQNKIKQGLSEDQIYNFLTDKYGEWILYDPKFNKNTYLLWFLPLLILLLGGAIIMKKLIKLKNN
ncbi:cytochrome c-type biogenesis protein CcmH [Candidatus Pelagibacter sp.]|nr:cytochrome c-type biogenesis protein CcmH [Candidatus Pelagibacter sp.]